ncbi:MAG TPA: hypothetical protein VGK40_05850, partial [Verrucomicrobiae bacterium]
MKTTPALSLLLALAFTAAAQTPPPAPSLVEPAAGASLVQPITLGWNPVVDPDGPIGSYTWQVGTSSTFGTIVASGFQNMISDVIPTPTRDKVSGLPNGTYFWRVKATQMVGGVVGSIDSAWSEVRIFTVTGLGPAPGTPSFISPANPSSFHVREFFDITWNAVPGANYYLLEVDDEPTFSYPLTLTTDAMQFGTKFNAGWGNEIPNIFYRVRAVSADNVRGLPSPTLTVHVVNTAPVPPPPTPLLPVGGASITIPFTFDWSDTANPQIAGYDLDIDNEPNFLGAVGVLLAQGVSRSDYLVLPDPLVEGINHFPPGQYFWRVRAVHGDVFGPWSSGASFNVVASPPTPPGLEIFSIIAEPGSVSGGNPTQARVTLNMPAGPGGVLVKIAPDLPHVQTPASVLVPEGKTDAWVSPITTVPVRGATFGTIVAAYGQGWQQSSIGLWPILWGLSLNAESVIGGNVLTGTLTLLNPAPPGGVEVTLVSSDTSLVAPPAKVSIPAGGTGATFSIPTAPALVPTRVVISSGTAFEGYRAPDNWVALMPAGSLGPAPSLAALSLASSSVTGSGGTTTGTVTLTGPAPAGGASVWLNGSMEGEVVTPPNVIVPAGSISTSFTITAPQVNAPRYVLIQARYGTSGGSHAKLLEIIPGPPGPPTLLAMAVKPFQGIGGQLFRGTVELVMVAPAGGGVVALSSDNPAAQVPTTVSIAAGNSANSFTITSSPVFLSTPVRIDATAGGVTKSFFIYLGPDPNAPPLLQSVAVSPTSVAGGSSATGTVFLSAPAPAGGASVTLATSSLSVAQAPGVVNVPAGQSSASFTVTTFPVTSSTVATITAFLGSASQSATLTVTPGGAPQTPGTPSLLSPGVDATVSQPATFDWSDVSGATSYTIQIANNDTFTAPLAVNQTVTVSQFTTASLPATRLWWRVRAINSAGVAGPFSASRRFQAQAAPVAASLSAVSVNPNSVVGGSASQGTVTLSSGAPSGGAVVSLSSGNAAVATVPVSVTVAAGATSASFTINTVSVATTNTAVVSAIFSGVTRTATLSVRPPPPPPPPASLSSVTVSPTNVTGGNGAQGTVTLTGAAPSTGAIVALSSANTNVATVPASVTVAAGAISASFTINTVSVATTNTAVVSATFSGVTRTAALTVQPPPPPPPPASLSSVAVSPISVTGGITAQGTVSLSGAAPSGGALVALTSGNTNAATVPTTVTVLAGATTANFTVTSRTVTASAAVTISAAYNSVTRTAA